MPLNLENLIDTASNTGKTMKCAIKIPNNSPGPDAQNFMTVKTIPPPSQVQSFVHAETNNSLISPNPSSFQMSPRSNVPSFCMTPSPVQVMGQMNHAYKTQKEYGDNLKEYELECEIARVLNEFKWNPIHPLTSGELPPQDFPTENLPEDLLRAAKSLVELTGLNFCLVLILVLGSIPHALRGRYRLKYSEWVETLTGYFLTLSSNGKRKTQALKRLKQPFNDYLKEIELKNFTENLSAKFIKRTHKIVYAQYNQEFKRKLIGVAPYDCEHIVRMVEEHAQAMAGLSSHFKNETRPAPRLFADDVTVKKLAISMKEQGEHMSIMDTEASLIMGFLSKKNADYSLFLKSYNHEQYSTESINIGSILLQNPALSILIFTQPTVLDKLLENQNFNDKGGLARFWVYLSEQPANINSNEFNPEDMDIYDNKINAMLERNFTQESPREISTINVSDAAGKILDDFRVTIRQWEDDSELEYMGGFLRKLAGSAMRLAGIIHCWRHDEPEQYSVSPIDMQAGVELAKLLFSHARYLYLPKRLDPLANAWNIANWITRFCSGARPSFTRRECLQRAHLHLNEARPALETLKSLNWIAEAQAGKELRYIVNPGMFDMLAAAR